MIHDLNILKYFVSFLNKQFEMELAILLFTFRRSKAVEHFADLNIKAFVIFLVLSEIGIFPSKTGLPCTLRKIIEAYLSILVGVHELEQMVELIIGELKRPFQQAML